MNSNEKQRNFYLNSGKQLELFSFDYVRPSSLMVECFRNLHLEGFTGQAVVLVIAIHVEIILYQFLFTNTVAIDFD